MQPLTAEIKQSLIQKAREAAQGAYAPYSNFPVGAALLTTDGEIITGINIENAAYPVTICAERVATFTAVARGLRDFVAIAVVTKGAGSPCGSCRQVMSEFTQDLTVLMADIEPTDAIQEVSLAELLPYAFGPKNLNE